MGKDKQLEFAMTLDAWRNLAAFLLQLSRHKLDAAAITADDINEIGELLLSAGKALNRDLVTKIPGAWLDSDGFVYFNCMGDLSSEIIDDDPWGINNNNKE